MFLIILGFLGVAQLAEAADFCWLDTQTRGVGKVPLSCAANEDLIGLFCYPKCPSGYARFGFDCHSVCPPAADGWRDDGLFCRKYEYGRGSGYPWKFGDGFNLNGATSRCERDYGSGKCEVWGAMVYPKCKTGYYPFGCCICRPSVPDCAALGLNGNVDLSCAKKIIIGTPRGGGCGAGQDYDAALCYPQCAAGYNGVGPVCWGTPPTGWVSCGAGAAKDSQTCASVLTNQILAPIQAVAQTALLIASFGTSSAATTAANSAKIAGQASKLKQGMTALQKLEKFNDVVGKVRTAYDEVNTFAGAVTSGGAYVAGGTPRTMVDSLTTFVSAADPAAVPPEDIARAAAALASLVDPTGIADVVASYTYPKCNRI